MTQPCVKITFVFSVCVYTVHDIVLTFSEATIRFLKAKLRVMQEDMDRLCQECSEKVIEGRKRERGGGGKERERERVGGGGGGGGEGWVGCHLW